MINRYRKESPESIRQLFNSIAFRYDIVNSLMSFHMHALWNQRLVKELLSRSTPLRFLDVCAGTAEIARRSCNYLLKKRLPIPEFHLVDFSSQMLDVAKKYTDSLPKEINDRFFFHVQDVQELEFEASFDAASIAYGCRNVQNVEKCLQGVYRALKPGGWCAIVELTRPSNTLLHMLHRAYLTTVIPLIGRIACSNKDAYSYLSHSIQKFIQPKILAEALASQGFQSITIHPLHFGIATLLLAEKKR